MEGYLLLDAMSPVLHVEGFRTLPGIIVVPQSHPVVSSVCPVAGLLRKCEM
jgi:hypothetical protein